MKYDQLPLPIDAQMFASDWNALGYALVECPHCARQVTYPANTHIYAVVCACGWWTEVNEQNAIVWHPASEIREAMIARQKETGSNN